MMHVFPVLFLGGSLFLSTLSADPIADKLGDIFEKVMEQSHRDGAKVMRRPVFAKDHGCLQAEFLVNPKLDPALRVGAFKEDRYPAWVRFSNDGGYGKDTRKSARGMAIKLVGVPGRKILKGEEAAVTQDFVMENYPVFFADNAKEFLEFIEVALSGDDKKQADFDKAHPETPKILKKMDEMLLADPLDGQYWTPTPYRLGDKIMKYMVKPCIDPPSPPVKPMKRENFLRENLIEHMKEKTPVCLRLYVQLQTSPTTTDRATVAWSEKGDGAYRAFGDLTIATGQDVDSDVRKQICENLSFTGWHATKDLEPVGSINEARGIIYQRMAKARRKFNAQSDEKILQGEPTELKLEGVKK